MVASAGPSKAAISLSVNKAEAQQRVCITARLRCEGGLCRAGLLVRREGLLLWRPLEVVRGFSYTGWADYAARHGIGCTPGTAIKGGDGIMYLSSRIILCGPGRGCGDLANTGVQPSLNTVTAVMSLQGNLHTDPSRRLISTYRCLTRLGDNHVIATQDEDREKPIDDCRAIAVGGMFSF